MADRAVGGSAEASELPAVLLVNDREGARVAIRSMLVPLGVMVVEADSGRAALKAVLGQSFAVILMDVRMPGMDGFETAGLIRGRAQSSRTPIIFVTAFGREDHPETVAAYASGAVDFVFAPVVADVLRAKVSVFVDLFLQSQQLRHSLDSITDLNAALRDVQARTQAVLDSVADGIVTAGQDGLIESFNPAASTLFGYREDQVIGKPLADLIAPEHRDEFRVITDGAPGVLALAGAHGRAVETLGCRRDGSTFAMEIEHRVVMLGDRGLTLAFVRDVSERAAYTESLRRQALHDGLTGLANRTLFGELASKELASARRSREPRAVLMMDLDGFKQVNDTLGHDQGDLLLQEVAQRLVGVLRETDKIARFGGDEFVFLPGGATDLSAASALAWKIQQTCTQPFVLNQETVRVTASVGIAQFPQHGDTVVELLRRADAAMYLAKRSGSGHAVFDLAQETAAAEQLALLSDLRQCVGRNELVLHYQPKINLATSEVVGVEVLLRWQHPDRGLLSPGAFMTEMQRTELIEPVTRWVLDTALAQQRVWRAAGLDLTIAVNISAHSLRRTSKLPETVTELIHAWGGEPDRLTLELTEGALVEAPAPEILDRLHETGARISIDDFGTGYSSLAYLQRLPVDELKIDQSFISHLSANTDNAIIVRSTIDLAHNLGLTITAEGVEDQSTLNHLSAWGCDSAQGYHLARPQPAQELTTWLSESSNHYTPAAAGPLAA
jgi:diguanylate cyclase (GGDEF)-like protein/PAS domain S-box-containing protein